MTPITATNDFVIKFANVNGSGSASANEMFAKAPCFSFSRWREKVPKGDEGGAFDLYPALVLARHSSAGWNPVLGESESSTFARLMAAFAFHKATTGSQPALRRRKVAAEATP